MLYKSIISRCDITHNGINRKVFLQFFSLPGLWGQILFDRFDQDKDGYISQQEFNAGLSICIRASQQEKLRFLFSLFDVDIDGYITESELILMVIIILIMLMAQLANIAPLIHIQKYDAQGDADSEQLAQYPPPQFTGIDQNQITLDLNSNNIDLGVGSQRGDGDDVDIKINNKRIGSSIYCKRVGARNHHKGSKSVQAAHRVYQTRCNKSFGMLSPCYGSPQTNQQNQHQTIANIQKYSSGGGAMAQGMINKTHDVKQSNDSNTIIDFAQFVISTYKNKIVDGNKFGQLKSQQMERDVSKTQALKSSFLNTIRARNTGLNFEQFKIWMKDLPIFLVMFGEINYQSILEDFTKSSSSNFSSSNNFVRSKSQYVASGSCLGNPFCGNTKLQNQNTINNGSTNGNKYISSIPIHGKGYLTKKGRKFGRWKQRYYILRGKFLFCFKRQNEKVAKKSIFLPGCQIDTMSDFVMTRKYGFRITQPNGRFSPLRLYANTVAQCKSWVQSLKRAGGMVAVIQKYNICEVIGKGKFSVVKRAINKINGKQVAVKIIQKKALNIKQRQFLRTELEILKVVRHPNLVQIYDITEFRDKVYIFMEYVQFGQLNRYIKKRTESLPEDQIATIVRECMNTLVYLHICGVIHRDLKPDNILVVPNQETMKLQGIRIVDFGLSKLMKPNQKVIDACGTLSYVAPQVLQKKGYDCKVDIWSVGVIMYLLQVLNHTRGLIRFRGNLPFDGKSKRQMISQIMQAPINMSHKIWNSVPVLSKDLILKMMNRDIPRRLSAKQILQHKWLKVSYKPVLMDNIQKFQNLLDQGDERLAAYSLNTGGEKSRSNEQRNRTVHAQSTHVHRQLSPSFIPGLDFQTQIGQRNISPSILNQLSPINRPSKNFSSPQGKRSIQIRQTSFNQAGTTQNGQFPAISNYNSANGYQSRRVGDSARTIKYQSTGTRQEQAEDQSSPNRASPSTQIKQLGFNQTKQNEKGKSTSRLAGYTLNLKPHSTQLSTDIKRENSSQSSKNIRNIFEKRDSRGRHQQSLRQFKLKRQQGSQEVVYDFTESPRIVQFSKKNSVEDMNKNIKVSILQNSTPTKFKSNRQHVYLVEQEEQDQRRNLRRHAEEFKVPDQSQPIRTTTYYNKNKYQADKPYQSDEMFESSRIDHNLQMHINQIRLSMARTPGNYLQKYKGSLCSGNASSNSCQRTTGNNTSSAFTDLSSKREKRNIFNRNSNALMMNNNIRNNSRSIEYRRGKAASTMM